MDISISPIKGIYLLRINQLLTIYWGVHITYFKVIKITYYSEHLFGWFLYDVSLQSEKKLFVTVTPNFLFRKGFDQNWHLNDFLQLKLNRKCGEKETTIQPLEFADLSALSASSPIKNIKILEHFYIGPKHPRHRGSDRVVLDPSRALL